MVPRSSSVRSRRPQACTRRSEASGTAISMKGLPPRASIHSASAASTGSSGTAKGILAITTCSQYAPGRSTPSAKLASPNRTLDSPSSTRALCLLSVSCLDRLPWMNTRRRQSRSSPSNTSCICRREENNTSVPREPSTRRGSSRMIAAVCAAASRGSALRSGTRSMPASAWWKGLGTTAVTAERGRPARMR